MHTKMTIRGLPVGSGGLRRSVHLGTRLLPGRSCSLGSGRSHSSPRLQARVGPASAGPAVKFSRKGGETECAIAQADS